MMGLGLGMDAMSASAAIGVKWNGPRQKFRLSWHMALAQFLMPCVGFALGKPIAGFLSTYGKYAAAALVGGLGIKMLLEVIRSHPGAMAEAGEEMIARSSKDPTRGWSLMAITLATSVDALVVGFSLAIRSGRPFTWGHLVQDASIIGLIAGVMALVGVNIGQRLGKTFGRPAEFAGAVVLILLAIGFVALGD